MATWKIYRVDDVKLDILKSNPPQLSVTAKGKTRTSGWKDGQLIPRFSHASPPTNGIYEFDFVATMPTGISLPVLTPIIGNYIFQAIPANLTKIIVHSETNSSSANSPASASSVIPKRTAIGYSEKMSFDEAFNNAIHNLPQTDPPYPDYLESIRVTDIGALFGGFPGVSKMYVKIESN